MNSRKMKKKQTTAVRTVMPVTTTMQKKIMKPVKTPKKMKTTKLLKTTIIMKITRTPKKMLQMMKQTIMNPIPMTMTQAMRQKIMKMHRVKKTMEQQKAQLLPL